MLFRKIIAPLIMLLSLFAHSALSKEGDFAADFDLPLLQSEQRLKLSDFRGKVVLLDFWASWCGPCRASFPAYDALRKALQDKFGDDKFEILAVNVDITKEEAIAFLQQSPVSFPILDEDTGGRTQQHYQLIAMPTSFLIDQEGVIRIQHSGFSSAYSELIEKEVSQLILNNVE